MSSRMIKMFQMIGADLPTTLKNKNIVEPNKNKEGTVSTTLLNESNINNKEIEVPFELDESDPLRDDYFANYSKDTPKENKEFSATRTYASHEEQMVPFNLDENDSSRDDFFDSGSEYIPETDCSSTTTDTSDRDGEDLIFDTEKEDDAQGFTLDERNSWNIQDESSLSIPVCSPLSMDEMQMAVGKRVREKDYCFYCETLVMNFARHICRNHSSECDVAKILSYPVKSKQRKEAIALLRKKGNYLNYSFKPKPVRKPLTATELLPCTQCLGLYSRKQLWRHRKKCGNNPPDKGRVQCNAQNFLIKHIPTDENLKNEVFPHMRADKISLVAKKDTLICLFGARYLKTHREKHFINVTSRKMRELSKLLLAAQVIQPDISNFFDLLRPERYDLIVAATKVVSKFNSDTQKFCSPTYAINISTSIKDCCTLAIQCVLKKKNLSLSSALNESEIKTLLALIESNWKFDISNQASVDLNFKQWNKITIVPLASDLKLLKEFLLHKSQDSSRKLKNKGNDHIAFKQLTETVFCRVILLNRRRPGELQRMLVSYYEDFCQSEKSNNYEEFKRSLTVTEQVLIDKFKRVVIRGKRDRGVPVLFTPDVQKDIQLLIHRRKEFVKSDNPYLFANPSHSTPLVGYKVLMKYAKACGAKQPTAITATNLRKHLATLSQLFNMTDADVDQLASFMGHTTGIHRKSYRLPDDVFQTAKISKLLLLMEDGAADKFKGKMLDEINIDLEENLMERTDDLNKNDDDEDEDEDDDLYDNDVLVHPPKSSQPPNTDCEPVEAVSHTTKRKSRKLVPWTEQQKEICRHFFKDYITQRKPPKRKECESLISQHPSIFCNKNWLKMKVFIQNQYMKIKN